MRSRTIYGLWVIVVFILGYDSAFGSAMALSCDNDPTFFHSCYTIKPNLPSDIELEILTPTPQKGLDCKLTYRCRAQKFFLTTSKFQQAALLMKGSAYAFFDNGWRVKITPDNTWKKEDFTIEFKLESTVPHNSLSL